MKKRPSARPSPAPVRLGIIGAENSHSFQIAKICNLKKSVAMRATHLWGETPQHAAASAEKGRIPVIVSHWRDMLGQVDGVMIDHRDGADHCESARFFLSHGVPVFIDKPLTRDLRQARSLLALAAKKRTPVCTFSGVPLQRDFRAFQQKLEVIGDIQSVHTCGYSEVDGPYGGIFFYGFHQVDVIVELMGTGARTVSLRRSGPNAIATITFSGGRLATMHCLAECGMFHWTVCGQGRAVGLEQPIRSAFYLENTRAIERFIRTGEQPWSHPRMLAPIAILQALQKALDSGCVEKVSPV